MKHLIRGLCLVVLATTAAPVLAQQAGPEENLDCAIWSAYQIGISQDEKVTNGLSIAMAWFIGQYEGQTGRLIDEPMAKRARTLDEAAMMSFTEACVGRFAIFGDRLGKLGALLDQPEQ
jgi:hypothetical protein